MTFLGPPNDHRCTVCHSAWAGNPPIIYHDPTCPHAGGQGERSDGDLARGQVRDAMEGVELSVTSLDAHANCASCDFSSAGSYIRNWAAGHTKRTGHTTVINIRAIERITPA